MPRLSDSMEAGTILAWQKQVGETVFVGDELVEIETDKANMTYQSANDGVLLEIVAAEGDTVDVGAIIARLSAESETLSPAPSQGDVGPVKASPIARRIARDRGIDLSDLKGSGPGGRIVKADIEAAQDRAVEPLQDSAAAKRPAVETSKGAVEEVELTRLQQVVARRMSESKATVPHFYVQAEIDMNPAFRAREQLRAIDPDRSPPSLNDLIIKACAGALRAFPRVNGSYRDGRMELYSRVNIGFAVAADDALVVPTINDADLKGLWQIAAESRLLAAKVRDGSITPPEISGGTFSLSNLGMYGVSSFQAVVNPPQAAILAVGEVAARPVVCDGELESRRVMSATLSCDHRIVYGAEAAQFLRRVRVLLEEPLSLAL
jgi:pyruvate dehydrogenase E2 component (dihydrolipoamide acetyltransferase)